MESSKAHLAKVALAIVTAPRGILAADQSGEELDGLLAAAGGKGGLQTRLAFRKACLRSGDVGKHLGGVILHYEAVTSDVNFAEILSEHKIALGGTLDHGFTYLDTTHEPITRGIEDVEERLEIFKAKGCKFIKWRSIVQVSSTLPSADALNETLELSARSAVASQTHGLVPICEPDIAFAGTHDAERYRQVAEDVWRKLFQKLQAHHVYLPGIVVKATWLVPGFSCSSSGILDDQCARLTVESMSNIIPPEVPGIAFLSGGMSLSRCLNLAKCISIENKRQGAKYRFTYSYGRALLEEPIALWVKTSGDVEQVAASMAEQVRLASEASVAE